MPRPTKKVERMAPLRKSPNKLRLSGMSVGDDKTNSRLMLVSLSANPLWLPTPPPTLVYYESNAMKWLQCCYLILRKQSKQPS